MHALDQVQASPIWLATEKTDMRCGFDRLAERVRTVIGEDPLSGHLFVFRSCRGDRLKILLWDGDGFVLWYKRLEAGVFKLPPQLLMNLPHTKMSELADWLPDRWKILHQARLAGLITQPPRSVKMWFTHRSQYVNRNTLERTTEKTHVLHTPLLSND